ncbi:MAG TPA: DMT family transporter [Thermohalobaculum sp.]|nr:DMT family transporter [Thermohalobaculum sp.]
MDAWIPITIAAAFFQNLRSALQKHLKGRLSTAGAGYARFLYAWPFALVYVWGLNALGGLGWPTPSWIFLAYCLAGGITQILFTVLLIHLFSFRNFAVGTTFSKLELVMVAVLGAAILGDALGPVAILAIVISAAGVMCLTMDEANITVRRLLAGLAETPTLIGLLCAACLGASVVFFRGGALSLGHHSLVMAAGYTFAVSVVLQTVIMGAWLRWREPGQLTRVIREWRWAGQVGVVGAIASVCWFTAFTLQNAAYVRALGQVELVFTFASSVLLFRERVSRWEVIGIVLVVGAILLLLLAGRRI